MRERSDNAAGQVELPEASQQASPSLKFIPLDEDLCRMADRGRSQDPVLDDRGPRPRNLVP